VIRVALSRSQQLGLMILLVLFACYVLLRTW
jgi:hypothetical protein